MSTLLCILALTFLTAESSSESDRQVVSDAVKFADDAKNAADRAMAAERQERAALDAAENQLKMKDRQASASEAAAKAEEAKVKELSDELEAARQGSGKSSAGDNAGILEQLKAKEKEAAADKQAAEVAKAEAAQLSDKLQNTESALSKAKEAEDSDRSALKEQLKAKEQEAADEKQAAEAATTKVKQISDELQTAQSALRKAWSGDKSTYDTIMEQLRAKEQAAAAEKQAAADAKIKVADLSDKLQRAQTALKKSTQSQTGMVSRFGTVVFAFVLGLALGSQFFAYYACKATDAWRHSLLAQTTVLAQTTDVDSKDLEDPLLLNIHADTSEVEALRQRLQSTQQALVESQKRAELAEAEAEVAKQDLAAKDDEILMAERRATETAAALDAMANKANEEALKALLTSQSSVQQSPMSSARSSLTPRPNFLVTTSPQEVRDGRAQTPNAPHPLRAQTPNVGAGQQPARVSSGRLRSSHYASSELPGSVTLKVGGPTSSALPPGGQPSMTPPRRAPYGLSGPALIVSKKGNPVPVVPSDQAASSNAAQ